MTLALKEIYQKRALEMEVHNKGLPHEYYIHADNPRLDGYILKGLGIHVYNLDRENMTPHCHLVDGDREIEVSLLDWSIINVKHPKGKQREWGEFSDMRDKFFKWLFANNVRFKTKNHQWLLNLWDNENPDNRLEKYKDKNISDEVKQYLSVSEIDYQMLKTMLYGKLSQAYFNKELKNGLIHLQPIELLKAVGLYEMFPISETDEKGITIINDVNNDVKNWSSHI